jgi:hypothetical protein
MDLDELKPAWIALERRLAEGEALTRQLLRETRLRRVHSALRCLAWGQTLQLAIGIGIAVIAGPFWIEHRHIPHLLVAGLLMHLYGVAMIAFSAGQLLFIARLDHAAPVVTLQRRLAAARRLRLCAQLWLGLPWWALWVVATVVGARRWTGVDIYGPWVLDAVGIGVVGMALTLWLPRRFAHTPRGARFIQRRLDDLTGRSLVRATRELDEIARFAAE